MHQAKQPHRLLLWDIDGTLTHAQSGRTDKHVAAVERVLGVPVSSSELNAGKTDLQILFELIERHRGNVPNEIVNEALAALDAISRDELRDYPVNGVPGVTTALSATRTAGWTNGLLTGNTPERAKAKITCAGMAEAVDWSWAFFGNESRTRRDLVARSAAVVRSRPVSTAIIVGDTPLDIVSAQAHGLPVVAVATGSFSPNELGIHRPSLLIHDWDTGADQLLDFLSALQPQG